MSKLMMTKEFVRDVVSAEIIREKLIECMGDDNDTVYMTFVNEKENTNDN